MKTYNNVEAARYLGVNIVTIFRWLKYGWITRSVKEGNRYLYTEQDLIAAKELWKERIKKAGWQRDVK